MYSSQMVNRIAKSLCQMVEPRLWMFARAEERVMFTLGLPVPLL